MVELSLALLGTFTAVYKQRPLTQFRTKAAQALLIYLVCQPEAHAREALMALLWPELPTKSAQGNLRHALYHLRRVIPSVTDSSGEEVPFVLANRQTIQVNPDGRFQLDMTQFETLTDSQKAEDWDTAVALYRDDFLSDFYLPDSPEFESWTQNRRADLRRRLLDTLVKLANHHLAEEHFEQAEQYARQQIAIDNLREEAHQQLMMILARNGRRTEALSHYQTLRQLLQDELQIEPAAETEALATSIRSGNLSHHPADNKQTAPNKTPAPIPHNLYPQATPFIGRHTELTELDNLLADPQTRLITILGAGGMGKTRLSLAVAERQLARQQFAHGIFFVPLAWLGESDRILSAIAEAMEIRLEAGETQLFNTLRTRQILLVLDNFEHLLDGSDLVRRLLRAAPQLQILVTSRERLRLQGEQVYPIQGLVVDETAVSDDARALFLQAAHHIRPDFQVAEEDEPVLNQICRLTEGMPLALELAAAWVDLLTLAEIAAEIQRNLNFLESDLRDLPTRHRSMQAVFAASWQRLAPAEQQLLAQLTIFKGGFAREAVTAVTNASLPDLAALVNKSLLTFDTANGRYHMHELLRHYAATQRDVDDGLLDRHSHYYCRWLAAQFDGLVGAEQMTVGRKIKADMDNLHTAVFHALQREHFTELARALFTLSEYYRTYGQLQEGINILQHIHTILDRQQNLAPLILFWTSLWLSEFYGRLENAHTLTFLQKAEALLKTPFFSQLDTQTEQASLLHQKAYQAFRQEPLEAVQLFRQSQELLEQQDDRVWSARNLIGLARAVRNAGDLDQAEQLTEQSLLLAQSLGNTLLRHEAQLLRANLANYRQQFDKAEVQLQESIEHLRQFNQPQSLALGLTMLGFVQFEKGHFDVALHTTQECHQVYLELGNLPFQKMAQLITGHCFLHLGDYSRSTAVVQEISGIAQTLSKNPQARLWLNLLLSQLAMLKGDLTKARHLLDGDWYDWQFCLGIIAVIEGDLTAAQGLMVSSLRQAIEHHFIRTLALTLALAAYLTASQGDPEQGILLYAVAQQSPFIANSRWMADVVGERITAVAQHLPPEAIAAAQVKGKTADMWQTAEHILSSHSEFI